MPALTAAELVLRALRIARSGASVSESRLYDDDAYLLIDNATHELAQRTARNIERRHMMQRSFSATAIDGLLLFTSPDYDSLLIEALKWSRLYDNQDDSNQIAPYIWKAQISDLKRPYLNPNFGYYTYLEGVGIQTRKKGIEDPVAALSAINGTAIVLRASYVPDFSGSNPVPLELEDDLAEILAGFLLEKRNANAAR